MIAATAIVFVILSGELRDVMIRPIVNIAVTVPSVCMNASVLILKSTLYSIGSDKPIKVAQRRRKTSWLGQ